MADDIPYKDPKQREAYRHGRLAGMEFALKPSNRKQARLEVRVWRVSAALLKAGFLMLNNLVEKVHESRNDKKAEDP